VTGALAPECFYICKVFQRHYLLKQGKIESFIPFRIMCFCWLCLFTLPARAQVSFSAQASAKEIGKSDYVEIQFVIENAKEVGNVQPPDFPDFNVVQGPNQSSGMSIVNGNMSQYKGISYVLQAKKTGTFTIKAATATVDGKLMHTSPLQITVRAQANGSSNGPPGFSPLPDPTWPTAQPPVDMDELIRPGENVEEKIRKNFFIRVEVSKTDCYLGEPIVATYKLYARLRSDSRVTKHPSLNGFSVYDMIDPSEDRVGVEKLNGKNYSVHIIRKTQLIPLQPGDITLDPMELDNDIYLVRASGSAKTAQPGLGGLLDRLFEPEESGTPFTQHLVIESKPVTIHVRPLPEEGKPSDFNGAVGKYTLSAALDNKEVDTGDAAILSVTVKGTGNLPLINSPVVNWPAHMESYDMNSKENIDKTIAPLGGSKTFHYSFIASKPGSYLLPAVRMSYFDPGARVYKNIASDAVPIEVHHLAKKKNGVKTPSPEKIHTPNWSGYALWAAAFGVILILSIFIFRESKKDNALKEEKAKEAAALQKMATLTIKSDPLEESRTYRTQGDYGKFYAAVNRTIWKMVSDNLQLPASELNKLNIASGLRTRGWTDDEIIELKNILNECEMKLYTPDYNTLDVERLLGEAESVTRRLTV
jgi:hypothetical protein